MIARKVVEQSVLGKERFGKLIFLKKQGIRRKMKNEVQNRERRNVRDLKMIQ